MKLFSAGKEESANPKSMSLSQCILLGYKERQNIDKGNFLLRPMEAIFLTEASCTCAARSSVQVQSDIIMKVTFDPSLLSLQVSAFRREKEFNRHLQDHKYIVAFVEPVKTNVLMDKFVVIMQITYFHYLLESGFYPYSFT